ncbi:MAG: MFS transporter [Paludibacteraceae bacterium]|nr:MFS transporter [Paludibacteraceae bacterium]
MAIASLKLIEPKIDTYTFNFKNYILQTKEGVKHLFRYPHLKLLAIYYSITVGIIWVLQDYFVNTFAKDSGYTEIEQSWAFASFYLISGIIILFITRKESRMPNKKVIYATLPLLLVGALLPGYFATKLVAYFLILTINVTSAVKGSLLDNYVNEEIESKYRATAMSSLNLGVSGIYMLILLSTAPLQDLYSNRLVWSLIGLIALIALIPLTKKLIKSN